MCVLLAEVLGPVIFRVTDVYTLNSRLDKLISVIEAHISAVSSTFCLGLTHGGLVTYNVCHHDSLLVMDSSLFGAKPLSEPMITWCLLELRNKFVWNFNENGNVLFGENVSKNVVLKMAAIFFLPHDTLLQAGPLIPRIILEPAAHQLMLPKENDTPVVMNNIRILYSCINVINLFASLPFFSAYPAKYYPEFLLIMQTW